MKSARLFLLLLSLATATPARSATFTEGWYLLRGRANLQIGNLKAAVEAFAKACELNPNNQEAMRSLGLAQKQEGLTDQAIAQFDRYLAKWPDDFEIAFMQADYLAWSRYDYRRKDAVRYLKLGLAKHDDDHQRRKLAKLLGRDKSTLDEALEQYQTLLKTSPQDEDLRSEYRKLLAWDPKHLDEAIAQQQDFVKAHPEDFAASEDLGKLMAKAPSRRLEAAKLYGTLVAKRPQDKSLRLAQARLLAGINGEEQATIAAYRAAAKGRNDNGFAVEFADALAKDPSSRHEALSLYDKVLKQQPQNERLRLKYARLLLAEKSDAAAAAQQYELVIVRDPKNSEAHRGAAQAYAWLGDNDRALAHGQKAEALGDQASEQLTGRLEEGREPRLGVALTAIFQPGGADGDDYYMQGFSGGVVARRDVTPFSTVAAQIGGESYADHDHTVAGPSAQASFQYRWDKFHKVDLACGYHGLGPSDRRLTGSLQGTFGDQELQIAPGVERRLRVDSVLAAGGATIGGETYGAARSDDAFVDLHFDYGATKLDLRPQLGVVSTAAGDRNPFAMFSGRLTHEMTNSGELSLDAAYALHIEHYQMDRSGLGPASAQPLPGGYVSPSLLLDNAPELALRYGKGTSLVAGLEAGPSLQLQRTALNGSELVLGAEANAYLTVRPAADAELTGSLSYLRLPDVNNRLEATLAYAHLF